MHSIILTGPESTGKTSLAKLLSKGLDLLLVEEYARTWMEAYGPSYSRSDVIAMEAVQRIKEFEASDTNSTMQLVDSDILTFMIWMEDKYGDFPKEWISQFKLKKSCSYVLCFPDIPWIRDSFREDEGRRMLLFKRYKHYLDLYSKQYIIIKGSFEERYKIASQYILDMS